MILYDTVLLNILWSWFLVSEPAISENLDVDIKMSCNSIEINFKFNNVNV